MNQRASFMDEEPSANSEDTDLDLSDFGVKQSSNPTTVAAGKAVAAHVAEKHQFSSRQASKSPTDTIAAVNSGHLPVSTRFTTGRNQQLNMKAKAETIEKLRRYAAEASVSEKRTVPQAEILELALDAYERERNRAG